MLLLDPSYLLMELPTCSIALYWTALGTNAHITVQVKLIGGHSVGKLSVGTS